MSGYTPALSKGLDDLRLSCEAVVLITAGDIETVMVIAVVFADPSIGVSIVLTYFSQCRH